MSTRLLFAVLGVLSCAPDYDDVPTKLVGVGYDPEEIGPSPTPYGGVVEYSYVNFAGAGLSLAAMQLGSFDEIGPNFAGFYPPYAATYGFSYVFDTKLSAADSLGGVTAVPPDAEETCYTTFDAGGPIGSFKTVDVGSWIELSTLDEAREGGMRVARYPGDYPSNEQDLFVYYFGIDFYQSEAQYTYVATPETGNNPSSLGATVARRRNFPFGEEVEFRFPGAITGVEAPVASLPRPSASVEGGNTVYKLPNPVGGVNLEWEGPSYDSYGRATEDGVKQTCLSYAAPVAEGDEAPNCETADTPASEEFSGQMYTGPWDTQSGVTFRWAPSDDSEGEIVSLSVRFLGPVDFEDPSYLEHVVLVEPDGDAEQAWNQSGIPRDVDVPTGRRAPTACEEGEWVFDDAYETVDGELTPAMRGDPFHNLSEVTCRLADDGEFVLTEERLAEALTYARSNGAQGAIFYFARSTEVDAQVPPAKDQYNQKLVITPVKLTSRAIDIGRFWFE